MYRMMESATGLIVDMSFDEAEQQGCRKAILTSSPFGRNGRADRVCSPF